MKKAVIFDLDGVIVSTDEYHYLAWKKMAVENDIDFDRIINQGLRGVSRSESLEIILEKSTKIYTQKEKNEMMDSKNFFYKKLLEKLSPDDILPGVKELLFELKERKIKVAIGSSSKNTMYILKQIGLENTFHAIADGNGIEKSKPDPEVFLLAAKLVDEDPINCVVIEDAYAGIDAAKAAGAKAVAVGYAISYKKADYAVEDLIKIDIDELLE